MNTIAPIAVSLSEHKQFGCPSCGYRSGYTPMSAGGTAVWDCASPECRKTSLILADGLTRSAIGIGDSYPELQTHPRRGIPSHGAPDKRPDGGGEFFGSRGIGCDSTPGCFVCGGVGGMYSNISGFVRCKAAGERVVAMFSTGARLDYRTFEPDRVQVKIGACDGHLRSLEMLDRLVKDGVITDQKIKEARQ